MDEQMSCGPDWSYNEGEETGQGDPRIQSPTRSSGRGSEGTNSLFCDKPPATSNLDQGGDMDMTVYDALCVLDKLECWRPSSRD